MQSSGRSMSLVALGGAAGALGRWGVGRIVPVDPGTFPWSTFAVNVIGCLLIGIAARRLRPATDGWFFAVSGVLGGFTTFSAFANETRTLADTGHGLLAATYVAASIVAGLVAVELGRGLASRQVAR